jgi:2'-5' RNA ligase
MSPAGSVAGGERVRLFCALQLPDTVVDRIVAWQLELPRGDFRLVPRENLHLTLAFLGHRPAGEVEAIRAELEQAARTAGRIMLRPRRYRETRSVGMLVFDDEDGCAGLLAADLHARLERLGVYESEPRPWLPHLTVARFRERPRLSPEPPDLGAVSPSGAAVYHSVLRPSGAQYVVLHAVGLFPLET